MKCEPERADYPKDELPGSPTCPALINPRLSAIIRVSRF
jgi:hypothetical protein